MRDAILLENEKALVVYNGANECLMYGAVENNENIILQLEVDCNSWICNLISRDQQSSRTDNPAVSINRHFFQNYFWMFYHQVVCNQIISLM